MRLEDAPRPGWYPDPEGSSRLRYWEGTDWSDRFRAPLNAGMVDLRKTIPKSGEQGQHGYVPPIGAAAGPGQRETDEIIQQVRLAARTEIDRAADLFSQRATAATRSLTPLITEYTGKVVRWARIVVAVAVVLLVAWLAFQIFAQVSMFEWIGDRIDNLTDQSSGSGSSLSPAVLQEIGKISFG